MTAPTHPEPRPDDEGRETAATTAPPRQHSYASMSFRGSFPRFVCTQCGVASTDARANEPCGRIAPPVAPHPAPLGATDEGLRPVKWEAVGGEAHDRVYVEEAEQRDGTRLYAVRQGVSALGRDGEWLIMEPLPSSRDEAYIAVYRFATIPEAVAALRAALQATP